MKKIKEMAKAFWSIPYMKYLVVLVIGVVLIGFVGSNSVLAHFQNKLKEEIDHFESEYQRDQSEIHQLQSNPKAMERIARERYFMKYADEEIFVLNDEEHASENTSHETAK